jgi:hypothetical protein
MEQQSSPALDYAAMPLSGANEWPNAACKRDRAYLMVTQFKNEDDSPHRIIVLDERDWLVSGTRLEALRQVAMKQDRRIKELLADIAARDVRHAQLLDRMDALREVRRAEKRVDVEAQLGIIGDAPTTTFSPKG